MDNDLKQQLDRIEQKLDYLVDALAGEEPASQPVRFDLDGNVVDVGGGNAETLDG